MTNQDCIFCKIGRGDVPSDKLFDDGTAFAIADLYPKAPTHILLIPYAHVEALAAAGVADSGYRLVANQGSHSGQEVPHFHLHVLGGKPLGGMG